MSSSTPPQVYHILEEVRFLADHVGGMTEADFIQDGYARRAFCRGLVIIGDALNLMPAEFRNRHNYIDWSGLRAIRNIIVHQYWRIDYRIVWDAIVNYAPEVGRNLEQIIENERQR